MTSATTSVSAVHVPRLRKNIQEVNEHVYAVLGTHWNRLYPDCLKIIQDMNECVYTVPGTHWNTWYPDCVRNVVNGHGYMVPGTHWNALRRCFQLVPGIFTPAQYIVHWHSRGATLDSFCWLTLHFVYYCHKLSHSAIWNREMHCQHKLLLPPYFQKHSASGISAIYR